jgi:hypothetical protein
MQDTLPVDQRVSLLLAQMTLQEKVNQLLHAWFTVHDKDIEAQYGQTGLVNSCSSHPIALSN